MPHVAASLVEVKFVLLVLLALAASNVLSQCCGHTLSLKISRGGVIHL